MPTPCRSFAPAAVLALALTVSACGDDSDDSADPAATVTDDATPSRTTESTKTKSRPSKSPAPQSTAGATLSVTVNGDAVSPAAETIEMSAGDVLTVRVTADRAGELHVHSSPEQYVEFGSGETRREIKLDTPGQVDIEEHESGHLVARLLVQ